VALAPPIKIMAPAQRKGILHFLCPLLLGFSLLWPGHSKAEFRIATSAGLNFCSPDQGADCESINPSGFLSLGIEYRFLRYLGIGLDYDYGWLNPEAEKVQITSSHFMPMLRAHYPLPDQPWELHLGLGMGYADMEAKAKGDSDAFYTFANPWTSLKTTIGMLYRFNEEISFGGVFNFYSHRGGERCLVHPIGQENCKSLEELEGPDQAVADLSQLGVIARYGF